MATSVSIEDAVRLACRLEATAGKPGNVHPQAAFDDVCYDDFVRSGDVVAPVLARAAETGVGPAVLQAVRQTQDALGPGRNTNLGIVLLLAPLAAVPRDRTLRAGIGDVLGSLTRLDAACVYEAIRLARPGGMGRVDEQDIAAEPTVTLLEAMRLAAGRDAIAAEYASDFELVLEFGVPVLAQSAASVVRRGRADRAAEQSTEFTQRWEPAIVELHLRLMSRQPDTLIARKCGPALAAESARRAAEVLDAGWPETPAGHQQLAALDAWLRSDGNRRNPGTTADLVTACLFAALREGLVEPPLPHHFLET